MEMPALLLHRVLGNNTAHVLGHHIIGQFFGASIKHSRQVNGCSPSLVAASLAVLKSTSGPVEFFQALYRSLEFFYCSPSSRFLV